LPAQDSPQDPSRWASLGIRALTPRIIFMELGMSPVAAFISMVTLWVLTTSVTSHFVETSSRQTFPPRRPGSLRHGPYRRSTADKFSPSAVLSMPHVKTSQRLPSSAHAPRRSSGGRIGPPTLRDPSLLLRSPLLPLFLLLSPFTAPPIAIAPGIFPSSPRHPLQDVSPARMWRILSLSTDLRDPHD
jgi:hypothetical protein